MDAATEAYIAELVEQAPPLSPEQQALILRTFAPRAETTARRTRKTRTTASDAA